MQVICLEEEAFYALVEQVVSRLKEKNNQKDNKWISDEEAMTLLKVKSKTTLQKLRDEGKIRFSQPQKKIILYDRESINAYIEQHTRETFLTMEEETTPSPEYIKGFNEGYILAQETPDLAKKLSKIEASTDRIKGFKDGKTQYLNERIREQRNKIFERPWDKGKSHSPDVTKDLEKDIDIEPEL